MPENNPETQTAGPEKGSEEMATVLGQKCGRIELGGKMYTIKPLNLNDLCELRANVPAHVALDQFDPEVLRYELYLALRRAGDSNLSLEEVGGLILAHEIPRIQLALRALYPVSDDVGEVPDIGPDPGQDSSG